MTRVFRGWVASALAVVSSFVVTEATRAQFQPIDVDLGRFGFETLAILSPSQHYRPFDMVSVRPDARAMAMGGAYLAMADDPLAVAWNPAGLASVEHFTLAADGFGVRSGSTTTGYPEILSIPRSPDLLVISYENTFKSSSRYGALAAAVPLWQAGSRTVAAGFSWRRFAEVARPEETLQDLVIADQTGFPVTIAVDRKERGAVEAYGPTLAVRLLPGLDLGATGNFLTGRTRVSTLIQVNFGGPGSPEPGFERFTRKYRGFAMDLGARLSLGERLRFAARFTPSFDLDVTGGAYRIESLAAPGTPQVRTFGQLSGYEETIPSLVHVGAAARAMERLWITADYLVQNLSEGDVRYTGEPAFNPYEAPLDPFSGGFGAPPRATDPALPGADYAQVSVGAEYLFLRRSWGEVPIRLGFRSTDLPYLEAAPEDYSYRYLHEEAIALGADPALFERYQTIGLHYNGALGEQPTGTGFGFGASLRTARMTYDLGVDVFSFDETRFYQDSIWDPVFNPNPLDGERIVKDDEGNPLPPTVRHPSLLNVERSVTTIRLSATYQFPDLF